MEAHEPIDVDAVKVVLLETLEIEDRAADLGPQTPLLGSVPELDSLAVMEVLLALEERFGITFDDDDIDGAIFESVAALTAFVNRQRG